MNRFIKIALVLILVLSILSGLYVIKMTGKDTIYDNVFIDNINVSGKTTDELKQELKRIYAFKSIAITYNGKQWKKELEDLGFVYNIDEAVSKAYMIGRSGSLFDDIVKIFSLKLGDTEMIDLSYTDNYAALEEFFDDVGRGLESKPVQAQIRAQDGAVSIAAGKDGKRMDLEALLVEAKAQIEKNKNEDISIKIPFIITSPELKYSQLKDIDGMIAYFESDFSVSDAGRAYNVELTAKKADAQLIFPGEEFSFMTKVGDVTASNGFKEAVVIVNNEFVPGTGGGVCQVSSTLYNALLETGIEITERRNHSLPVNYVPMGRDATVANLSLDLKYRNNYDFPIYIRTYTQNRKMKVEIYGNTTKAKKVQLYTDSTPIHPTTIYKNDPSLEEGFQMVQQAGVSGYRATTYKMENGQKIVISNDVYSMQPRIILVGTKKRL